MFMWMVLQDNNRSETAMISLSLITVTITKAILMMMVMMPITTRIDYC